MIFTPHLSVFQIAAPRPLKYASIHIHAKRLTPPVPPPLSSTSLVFSFHLGTMDGASFCGETTKWDAATNKCQATFNGALAACKAHRGDYGWTCEVACKA